MRKFEKNWKLLTLWAEFIKLCGDSKKNPFHPIKIMMVKNLKLRLISATYIITTTKVINVI